MRANQYLSLISTLLLTITPALAAPASCKTVLHSLNWGARHSHQNYLGHEADFEGLKQSGKVAAFPIQREAQLAWLYVYGSSVDHPAQMQSSNQKMNVTEKQNNALERLRSGNPLNKEQIETLSELLILQAQVMAIQGRQKKLFWERLQRELTQQNLRDALAELHLVSDPGKLEIFLKKLQAPAYQWANTLLWQVISINTQGFVLPLLPKFNRFEVAKISSEDRARIQKNGLENEMDYLYHKYGKGLKREQFSNVLRNVVITFTLTLIFRHFYVSSEDERNKREEELAAAAEPAVAQLIAELATQSEEQRMQKNIENFKAKFRQLFAEDPTPEDLEFYIETELKPSRPNPAPQVSQPSSVND